jgi:hypothetical protein
MSNFVEIKSSPAEIIGIANGIHSKGASLVSAVSEINREIVDHENHPDTFPSDQFTDGFTKEYHKVVEAADGKSHPSNEAVRVAALYCGTKLTEIGDYVAKAMVNYEASDEQGGDDIAKTAI